MAPTRLTSQLVGVLDVYVQQYIGQTLAASLASASLANTGEPNQNITTAATPTLGWYKMGPTDGEQAISHGGGLTYFRDNNGTGPTKSVRPEEDVTVTFTVVGLTLENYAYILSGSAPSTTGKVQTIGIGRGLIPNQFALILRGTAISPWGNFPGQYVFPLGVFDGEPNPTFSKDGRAELEVEFHALEDDNQTTLKKMGWFEVRVE